jgi:FMN-dependent NADH-azoreductase
LTTLVQISSSINNGKSQSSQLADRFVAAFRDRNPDARIWSHRPCPI